MRIEPVTPANLPQAAYVHALSWQESHRGICSPAFIAAHTPQRQADMLNREILSGKHIYMLTDGEPAAVVAIHRDVIEHLYVLPDRQSRGYGSELLSFAIQHCQGTPTLWVLNANERAQRFYERRGFRATGVTKPLSDALCEIEMRLALRLAPISAKNWQRVVFLTTEADGSCPLEMQATMSPAFSLLQAAYEPGWECRLIEAEGEPVGFAFWRLDEDFRGPYLCRYMIDARHQGKGWGRGALYLVISAMRKQYGRRDIFLTLEEDNIRAKKLYTDLGFRPTGDTVEGEAVYILRS